MPIQLRQICLVARELEPVISDLTYILGVERCFVDDGVAHFGLENTLLAIGNNFLEVVAPIESDTAAGRYLDRRGGDGGYMVICQAGSREEQQRIRANAIEHGVRVAHESERDHWNICQLHPRDMIAAFLEVDWDDECDFEGKWMPAGGTAWKDKVSQDCTVDFAGVELQGPDVEALSRRWSEVTMLPLEGDAAEPRIELANAAIRFVPETDGRGPGLGGIDLRVRDPGAILERARERGCPTGSDSALICGTRFNLQRET